VKTGAPGTMHSLTAGVVGRGAYGTLWGDYRRVVEKGIAPHSAMANRHDPKRADAKLRKFSWQSDD